MSRFDSWLPSNGISALLEVGLLRRRGFLRLIIGWLRVRVPPPGIAGRSSSGRAPVSSVAWFSGRFPFQPARGERRGSFPFTENTTSPALVPGPGFVPVSCEDGLPSGEG